MRTAVAVGVGLGVLYTLSPLTVLSLAGITALAWRLSRGMSRRERSWFLGVIALAMALRMAAIAGLVLTADSARPHASFFGDEEVLKNRTVWLRNVSMGVPISPADLIYVFDEVGRSSHLYLLAYVQALVGDAPYGLNVLNAAWFVGAALLLHRVARRAYGGVVALAGLVLLLFLPSLFGWSISVLKEPLYMLLAAVELTCAIQVSRATKPLGRLAAVAGVVATAFALDSVRVGGWLFAMAGSTLGLAAAFTLTRPRLAAIVVVAAPLVLVAAMMHPGLQLRALARVQDAAFQHWGHVATPGFSYKLLDPHFYNGERRTVYSMTPDEAARFVIRATVSFVTVPRPSQIESRTALAFLPEQAVWYTILLLLPVGAVLAFRLDPVVTSLLVAHGLVAAFMVALTGGNIGTLIRHRGLTLPYFSFLAAVGVCWVIGGLARLQTARPPLATATGDHT